MTEKQKFAAYNDPESIYTVEDINLLYVAITDDKIHRFRQHTAK